MKPLIEWRRAARDFSFRGRRIAWWMSDAREGEKPALVLMHGYPTSSWDWTFVWPALSTHFRLVALDMLGFGLSEKPRDIDYSIFEQADLQEALLNHLGISEAHILAHDYGDTVAQELLARRKDGNLSFTLRSVVLLNGGLFPEQHRARPVQKLGLSPLGFLIGRMMSRARLEKTLREIFGPATPPSALEIDAHFALMREGGGAAVLHKLLRYIPERRDNRTRWVGALTAGALTAGALADGAPPIMLIDGGADPVSGAHMFEHFKKLVPDADAVLLPGIGHYPQTEAPEAVAALVIDFHRRIGTLAS